MSVHDAWNRQQAAIKTGEPLPDDFDKQNLLPPFELRDREADMRTAYTFFADKLGIVTNDD